MAAENEAITKLKAKQYTDAKHGAQVPNIEVADKVLLKQNRQNKLDTAYGNEPYTVTAKFGSELLCQNEVGKTVRRNVTFAKKISKDGHDRDSTQDSHNGGSVIVQGNPCSRRSWRQHCLPQRLGEFRVH